MDYGEYISEVINGKQLNSSSRNEIENYVSNIINQGGEEEGEKESFCLLQFFENSNKVHLYEVKNEECRGKLRWWVEKMNLNYKHNFDKDINNYNGYFGPPDKDTGIVKLDRQFEEDYPELKSINDNLKQWVSGLGLNELCKKIYIKGPYSKTFALIYALQNGFKVVVNEVPNGKYNNKNLDINFPELMVKAVNLYNEQITLHQYRNLKTYIPVDDNTLNSPFFKNAEKICKLTWKDILPIPTSTTDDIVIPIATSEYKFKLISIEGYKVDLFRNVFIRIKDYISGETKIVHVYDPFKNIRNGECCNDLDRKSIAKNNFIDEYNGAIEDFKQEKYKDCLRKIRQVVENLSIYLIYNMTTDDNETQNLIQGRYELKKDGNKYIYSQLNNINRPEGKNLIYLFYDFFFYKYSDMFSEYDNNKVKNIKSGIGSCKQVSINIYNKASEALHGDSECNYSKEEKEKMYMDRADWYLKDLTSIFRWLSDVICFDEQTRNFFRELQNRSSC